VGARRRAGQERLVAVVRLVVLLDEVADVDLLLPQAGLEAVPRCGALCHWITPLALLHARTSPRSSRALVWRAIISSSLVGITHADPGLRAREIRGPPRALASASSSTPSHRDASQI